MRCAIGDARAEVVPRRVRESKVESSETVAVATRANDVVSTVVDNGRTESTGRSDQASAYCTVI